MTNRGLCDTRSYTLGATCTKYTMARTDQIARRGDLQVKVPFAVLKLMLDCSSLRVLTELQNAE
jgi:hypothetical protein